MKAIQILGDASDPRIVLNVEVHKPETDGTNVLVKVHAAGITGDEVQWPEVYETPERIPGHEISGVIAAVGPDYKGSWRVGDEVYALTLVKRGKAQAEYTICPSDELAPKPSSISHAEAAALPIPLLTALEAITEHGKVTRDMRVLVTGASGAVGLLFVQLAKHLVGATVVALASPRHHSTLKQRGASECWDYNIPGWEHQIPKVDVVFDAAGGDVLAKSWVVVKDKSTIVTIADPAPSWAFDQGLAAEAAEHPNVGYKYFIVSPNLDGLKRCSQMIDQGVLDAVPVQSFPLDKGVEAWAQARERNRGYKVVLDMVGGGHSSRDSAT